MAGWTDFTASRGADAPGPRTWWLAGLILALQLAFCAVVLRIDTVAEQINGRRIAHVQIADMELVPQTPLADGAFYPTQLSETCCAAPAAHVRAHLSAADVRVSEPAILIVSAYDNAFVYLNGVLLSGQGRLGRAPSNMGGRPILVRIPPALAVDGAQIDILVQRAVGVAHMRPFYVGEYGRLYPSYLALRALRSDLLFMNAAFGAFLAGLAFCAAPLFTARGLLLSLSGLGASWALQHVGLLANDPPWGSVANYGLYYAAFLATLLFSVWFFVEWTSAFAPPPPKRVKLRGVAALLDPWNERARRWLGRAVAVAILVSTVTIGYRLSFDLAGASHAINLGITWFGLAAMTFCLVRIVAYYLRIGLRSPIEASALIFVIVAAIADIASVRFFHGGGVLLGAAVTFFPLALLVSLAARAGGVFAAATASAERLNVLVGEREQQIRAGLAELQRREKEHLLTEERSRIMRDMHDGVGGQLLGLILQARSNRLSGDRLVQGLEETLADLRLVVDSLEQSEGSLTAALGAFRARIEPRCEAAGAALIWRIEDVGPTPGFGPDSALQIYRILQEACTNALTHGKPDRIEVTLKRTGADGIELSLEDNGGGFDAATIAGGRGLANMRHRAARIGARLQIAPTACGVRVTLNL